MQPLRDVSERLPSTRISIVPLELYIGESTVKKIAVIAATLALMGSVSQAQAGCVTGAIVGGIAGHFAHHGLAGAGAGCALGHVVSRRHAHHSFFHRY